MMADFPEPRTRAGQDRHGSNAAGGWGMQRIAPRTGHGVVNQAKGAVMLRYGIGSPLALALLVRWSRRSGNNLEGSAESLVTDLRGGPSNGDTTALVRWLDAELEGVVTDTGL